MKADKEFIEYIERRYEYFSKMMECTSPNNEDERFRHIFSQGNCSALKEVLCLLDVGMNWKQ